MAVRLRDRVSAVALPHAPTRAFWARLVLVSVVLRVIVEFGLLGGMPISSDALSYSEQAHHVLHPIRGADPYYWPPGTSYLLVPFYWAFGVHAWSARLATLLVSVAIVITTTLLGLRLLRQPKAAMLAGWLCALYPGMLLQASQPFSFDLTLLCVNLTVLFAVRGWQDRRLWNYVVAGLALGASGLTRPSTLIIGLALVVFGAAVVLLERERDDVSQIGHLVAGSALAAVFCLAALAPAVAHNEVDHQGLTLSVNNELNIWIGNNPYTPVYRTDRIGQHPVADFPADQRSYLSRYRYGDHPTRAQRSADLDEAERFVEDHPAITGLRTLNRARAFWGFDYTIPDLLRSDWGKSAKVEAVGLLFDVTGYVVLIFLVILGAVFARAAFRPGAGWLLISLVVAFELPYVFSYAAGRWHYPVLGLLAIPAGVGAAWLMDTPDRWRRIRASRAFWIATVVFVLLQLEYAAFTIAEH